MLAPLRQAATDDLFELGGKTGSMLREWRQVPLENCNQDVGDGRAGEGRHARHHLIKHYAEAEDVRPRIHLLAASLLRRHITRRAHYYPSRGVVPDQCRSLRISHRRLKFS